jgi:pimeloyl-ACP methyl ester carboxylesterase
MTVINAVTKDRVIILGFSDGGYSAHKLGEIYPERVKKRLQLVQVKYARD